MTSITGIFYTKSYIFLDRKTMYQIKDKVIFITILMLIGMSGLLVYSRYTIDKLESDNFNLAVTNEMLENVIKEQKEELEKKEESILATEKTLEEMSHELRALKTKQINYTKKLHEKISEARNNKEITKEEKNKQISTIKLQSLWDNYCIVNKTHCKE